MHLDFSVVFFGFIFPASYIIEIIKVKERGSNNIKMIPKLFTFIFLSGITILIGETDGTVCFGERSRQITIFSFMKHLSDC